MAGPICSAGVVVVVRCMLHAAPICCMLHGAPTMLRPTRSSGSAARRPLCRFLPWPATRPIARTWERARAVSGDAEVEHCPPGRRGAAGTNYSDGRANAQSVRHGTNGCQKGHWLSNWRPRWLIRPRRMATCPNAKGSRAAGGGSRGGYDQRLKHVHSSRIKQRLQRPSVEDSCGALRTWAYASSVAPLLL